MSHEFTFKIDGSFTPDTLPLERLGQYLAALGDLLGETANVHFAGLTKGSAVIHARIDDTASPKVERRVRQIAGGDAPKGADQAYLRIDSMLRDDNATGHLIGGDGNVIHVDFPGRNRPTPLTYGPIKQPGSIDGEVVRVEGSDKTVHVGVIDGPAKYSLEAPEAMGKELAALFRAGPVRFHGEGTWMRYGDGRWELRKFRIDRFDADLDRSPIGGAIAQLRKIGPGDWALRDDPIGDLMRDRIGEAEAN